MVYLDYFIPNSVNLGDRDYTELEVPIVSNVIALSSIKDKGCPQLRKNLYVEFYTIRY